MKNRFVLIAAVFSLLLFSCGGNEYPNDLTSSGSHADAIKTENSAKTESGNSFVGTFYRFTMSATEGCFLEFKDGSGSLQAFRSKCDEEYAYSSGSDTNAEVVGTKFKINYSEIRSIDPETQEPIIERKYIHAEVIKEVGKGE